MSTMPTTSSINTTALIDNNRDINDIFDDIVLTEEKHSERGYAEGYRDGVVAGNPDGYHLGYHRGAELGAELGYYAGVVQAYQKTCKVEKIQHLLEHLNDALVRFPQTNDENVDIFETANAIRAQFKKVCALLKINGKYPDTDELNF